MYPIESAYFVYFSSKLLEINGSFSSLFV